MNLPISVPSSGGSRTSTSALNAAFSTSTGPTRYDTGGLDDTPAGITDRDALLKHCGRKVMPASVNRNFNKAYRCTDDGETRPKYLRVDSHAFSRCQYVIFGPIVTPYHVWPSRDEANMNNPCPGAEGARADKRKAEGRAYGKNDHRA